MGRVTLSTMGHPPDPFREERVPAVMVRLSGAEVRTSVGVERCVFADARPRLTPTKIFTRPQQAGRARQDSGAVRRAADRALPTYTTTGTACGVPATTLPQSATNRLTITLCDQTQWPQ